MKGIVDDQLRALLSVDVRAALSQNSESVEVWIDTAYDGHFVFPKELIRQLKLEPLVETEAVLADMAQRFSFRLTSAISIGLVKS